MAIQRINADYRTDDDMKYRCDICGEKFKRKCDAKAHKVIHGTDKEYLESDVGKWYKIPYGFNYDQYVRIESIDFEKKYGIIATTLRMDLKEEYGHRVCFIWHSDTRYNFPSIKDIIREDRQVDESEVAEMAKTISNEINNILLNKEE